MDDKSARGMDNDDAFDAIFALNMGDFVTEHLISGDLLARVNTAAVADPERLRKQLDELVSIYSLDNTLSLLGFHADQGTVLYDAIAMSLAEMFQVDACHLFQAAMKDGEPHFLSLSGTSVEGVPAEDRWTKGYALSEKTLFAVEAFEDGFPLVVTDLDPKSDGWKALPVLHQERTRAVVAVPLTEAGRQVGLLLFENYTPCDYPQETIDLAEATANVFVVSLRLQRLLDQAQKMMTDPNAPSGEMLGLRAQLTECIADLGRTQELFVTSLAEAIDARNDYTLGHSRGVASIARSIAEALSLNEKTVDLVYYAGLLGALDKIHVPQEILTKEEALTPAEMDALRNSPNMGVGLLMKMNFLAEVIPYVDYQKERWDGKESRYGLSGRSIPLGARIIAVADAYHALTNPRPYRPEPMSTAEAVDVLKAESGAKWDPDVVASLARVLAASAA